MDKKLKAKWVKALRSGEYRQTKGILKEKDESGYSFCCLGVIRDLAWPGSEAKHLLGDFLSQRHMEILGITFEQQEQLANLNDGNPKKKIKRRSFKQIANWIEKNL